MADLLAKQGDRPLRLSRNQEAKGEVISITPQEVILDLGTKAEGVLSKRDIPSDVFANLKEGDKLDVFVLMPENESGQVVLTLQKSISSSRSSTFSSKFKRFEQALNFHQVLTGKALEVNKGGLIVEVNGVRGFLPSSQVSLSQATKIEELVGQDVSVSVIEVDPSQNRLIFSQKTNLTDDDKAKLGKLKVGERVKGEVAAVLPFGIFVTIKGGSFDGLEGLVHVSEISWERMDEPSKDYKIGQEVEAQVISVDESTGRVNLSIKQLSEDPFKKLSEKYQPDDVVKGTVSKINNMGAYVSLENGAEGIIPQASLEAGTSYEVGQALTCIIDNIDLNKRRITLAPFITSTKGLIYK